MLASRRTILALGGGAAAALVGGCSADSIPIIGPADPDDELRRGVAASERELIAAYDAAIGTGGRSAGLLNTLRQQHVDHLTAVTQDLDDIGPVASSSTTATPSVGAAALRRLEAAATRQRIEACAAAADADLAELLARIAASESGHVAALGRARA